MITKSANVCAFLAMREAWQQDIEHGNIDKAIQKMQMAYLFRRNNFNNDDWRVLDTERIGIYRGHFRNMLSRKEPDTVNTNLDMLTWAIIYDEIHDAMCITSPKDEKIRKRILDTLDDIKYNKFTKQDWEKLIDKMGQTFIKEEMTNEMNKLFPKKKRTKTDKLWYKCHKKLLEKISKYIVSGATVKCSDLMAAIDAGIDIDILKYMIKHCDNIYYRDENGQNVLHHCAIHYMSIDLLRELLLYGAHSSDLDKNLKEPRDCLAKELWGEDYGSAKGMLRPSWTYFYCE
ncbi:MAG: hypothetical protein IKP05_03940 [Alphaproteobacteria bacterium]|nr:hypothetical protein [Alphaproteobacteria bacterium]